jgi:hypothetical protein
MIKCMVVSLLGAPCIHCIYISMYGFHQPYVSGCPITSFCEPLVQSLLRRLASQYSSWILEITKYTVCMYVYSSDLTVRP